MQEQCTNPVCAQYRLQHKNVTIKRLELEKELQQIKRTQTTHYNQALVRNEVTPMRDAATGDMGLMVGNGEIVTPEKLAKRMEMSARCLESLQASEKHNKKLAEENRLLKQGRESVYNEMRRLENVLSGFEKARKYDNFSEAKYREAMELNEELAEQVEDMEQHIHILEEENAILKQQQHRGMATASRTVICDDEDSMTAASFITSDGRIPPQCPCDPVGCAERYEAHVIASSNPADAFAMHMGRMHKVACLLMLELCPSETPVFSVCPLRSAHQRKQITARDDMRAEANAQSPEEEEALSSCVGRRIRTPGVHGYCRG